MTKEPLEYLFEETDSSIDFLVIWLHGLGADGYDFVPLSQALELPYDAGIRYVFPHAPERKITINNSMVMRGWYDVANTDFLARAEMGEVEESCRLVSDLIQVQQKETGVPFERIFVGGFSQGGAVALHLGLRYPIKLAGILSLSSYVLSPIDILSDANPSNKDTPVFLAHGVKDDLIPFQWAKKTEEILQKLSHPYSFYPHKAEHTIPMETIKHMSVWLTRVIERFRENP